MKVSLNTAQYHSNVDLMPKGGVDELVQKIGAQLGAVEIVEHWGSRYDGIVVAKVMKCEKHPNADKLHVCLIDDGGITKEVKRKEGFVEVVCGAPNVESGQVVAWIPPGATVPSTYDKEPFVLEARELRGVVSNGMIASASELGISDDHGGILVIDPEEVGKDLARPGTEFKKLYGLDDMIINIENKMFTHRPDCFGVIGVAREIAGIQGLQFKSPEWYLKQPKFQTSNFKDQLELKIDNQLPDLVSRFMAVAMSGVQIKPSPIWMQTLLTRVGVKPINNVVDTTNYLAYLTAQPLHAYDYDKVSALSKGDATLVIRHPQKGETVALLNGKTVEPRKEAIMIATDKELVGIGGVMGGTSTEVDNNTKNIIVECANFDMYSIRRTSMEHGLFTEAVTRFNKGQSPLQNDRVIAQAMQMLQDLAHAVQASTVIDSVECDRVTIAHDGWNDKDVKVTAEFVNSRLGLELDINDIDHLLKNVEFGSDKEGESLKVYSPFWRTDIEIREDIVEEIGRLLGYDKLPLELPKRVLVPTKLDTDLVTKKRLRTQLAELGVNEVLTYSFVHGNVLESVGQNKELAFKLTNALSPDLQYYRLSLTPSLLTHIHPNIKAGHDRFALFEIGKVHSKSELEEGGVPREFGRVALIVADKKSTEPAYFQAKKYVHELLGESVKIVPFDDKLLQGHKLMTQMTLLYDPNRSAMIIGAKGYPVGVVGEFTSQVNKRFKLPRATAGFELFLSAVGGNNDIDYTPLSKFPSTNGDITLEVDSSLSYGDAANALDEALQANLPSDQYVDWKPHDIFSSEDIGAKKRLTFRVSLTSYSHTLTDKVLSELLDSASSSLAQKIHSKRI